MRHRTELIRRTARALGVNYRYASAVVREFINQSNLLLAETGYLVLDDLGRFNAEVVIRRPAPGTREVGSTSYVKVHFSKSRALKDLLDDQYMEDVMDKLGVDTSTGKDQDQLEKEAAEGCPECGRKLQKHGSVLICPEHGSAPFEKAKGD